MSMVLMCDAVCFFKQKTAYEMRISDWSSDVCSSDLNNRCYPPVKDSPAQRPIRLFLWRNYTARSAADGRRWTDLSLMADESITVTDPNDTRDLDAFLGIKPEKPWAQWGVRGGIAIGRAS